MKHPFNPEGLEANRPIAPSFTLLAYLCATKFPDFICCKHDGEIRLALRQGPGVTKSQSEDSAYYTESAYDAICTLYRWAESRKLAAKTTSSFERIARELYASPAKQNAPNIDDIKARADRSFAPFFAEAHKVSLDVDAVFAVIKQPHLYTVGMPDVVRAKQEIENSLVSLTMIAARYAEPVKGDPLFFFFLLTFLGGQAYERKQHEIAELEKMAGGGK